MVIVFSHNPQDRTVFAAGTTTVAKLNSNVSTDKVWLSARLEPNPDGHYVYAEEDDRFTAACAFASIANAVAATEESWGESIQWATRREKLAVIPDAGQDLNAYYMRARGGVFFFHDTDKLTGETVYSGRSSEVTSHEAFHAILDAKRPEYLGSWDPDPVAFHESMGDIGALALALQNERVLDLVARQTGGDLSKPNAAAALGEELGLAINHKAGHNVTGGAWTRNAINNFTWVDPDTLPSEAPADQLSSEPHSLSRLWTGAMYEVLTGIVNGNLERGLDVKSALRAGGEELLKMQGRLLQPGMAPEGSFRFQDMARALICSENELNGGKYSALIAQVMERRLILPQSAGLLAPDPGAVHSVTVTLEGEQFGPFAGMEVSHKVSGDRGSVLENRLAQNLARLIANGEILLTLPNQDPSRLNLIKADGEPYRGVVRWTGGKPVIEPTYVIG
ncbi:MAG: hypothetical protein KF760_22760 [Candidatus Eremiobacteraeota bacterium]|nr:hypothetical protein [Candidatus Eremiobacteraeota bacterium]